MKMGGDKSSVKMEFKSQNGVKLYICNTDTIHILISHGKTSQAKKSIG